MIVDEVVINVEAGDGGNGCISFRREKYIPRGGPDGGNGGRGGDVYLEARNDVHTLVDFIYHPLFRAHYGEHGKGKNMHGREAEPITVRVPVGTLVRDETNQLIIDMNQDGLKYLIAKGGRGGRGNSTFTTSTQQAPRLAERGEPGEKKTLRLELRLLADVGIVGFPNAGKSTLLSRVTHARPKIADYPFTTLEPQLGVVQLSGDRSFVLADVPGLIEGASQGKGLGTKFLKHLERTKFLIHLVEIATLNNYMELLQGIKTIKSELKKHSVKLSRLPQIIVLTKIDAISDQPVDEWLKKLKRKKTEAMAISAVTGKGVQKLLERTWALLMDIEKKPVDPPSQEKETVYGAKERFRIEKKGEAYHVIGPEITKWVSMTNFDNIDATERFYKILKRMGVIKELKKHGVKNGDTIFCHGEEMTYESERLGV
jgi:GTPase